MINDRLLSLDNALTVAPFGGAIVAQHIPMGQPANATTVALAIVGVVGVLIRGFFADRDAARRSREMKLETENIKLKEENLELRKRSDIVVKRPDVNVVPKSDRPCNVLLLEDTPDLGHQLARMLRNAGHSVRRAANVAECNRDFDREPPDVLVFDLGLPDADGEAAFDHALNSGMPFRAIVVTGEPNGARLDRLRDRGVTVLTKPVGAEVLMESIKPPAMPMSV